MIRKLRNEAVRTQDERATLVPTPDDPSSGSFFGYRPSADSTLVFLICSNRPMTDRPASWRMPTPNQMENLAATVRGNAPPARTPGPGDEVPPEYWQSILDDVAAD